MLNFFLIILLPLTIWSFPQKRIALVHNWNDNPNDPSFIENSCLKNISTVLKEYGIVLKVTDLKDELDDSDLFFVVVWNKPSFLSDDRLCRFPKGKLILFAWEPPSVQPELYKPSYTSQFKRIYSWDDDWVDGSRVFKFHYPVFLPFQSDVPSFLDRKLLVEISSNKHSKDRRALYEERKKVIQFFEEQEEKEFDFYGWGWEPEKYRNYRGVAKDKLETLKNYRFAICYENMQEIKGYVTEKIFDCFAVGTVPIYWGADNIEEFIPNSCFIDRRHFKNILDLYNYLHQMNEATYQAYVTHIRRFLSSHAASRFASKLFEIVFLEAVKLSRNFQKE